MTHNATEDELLALREDEVSDNDGSDFASDGDGHTTVITNLTTTSS